MLLRETFPHANACIKKQTVLYIYICSRFYSQHQHKDSKKFYLKSKVQRN